MTLLEERPPAHAETRYTRRAWLATALVPVGLVIGVVASFAAAAVRAAEPAGRRVLTVSIPVLVATIVLLPLIAVGVAGWLIALAVDAAVVGGYFAWRYCR